MCRIAFFPGNTVKHKWTPWFMDWLEARFGGHGNGVGFWVDGKSIVVKGVHLKSEDLVVEAEGPTLFHTRLASAGTIRDSNCHPYVVGGSIYCHNGTYGSYRSATQKLRDAGIGAFDGDITDSLVLANVAEHFDRGFDKLSDMRFGVLVRMDNDLTARVVVTGYSFAVGELVDTGELVYASEFPEEFDFVKNVKHFSMGSIATISDAGVVFEQGGFRKAGPTTFQSDLARFGIWGVSSDGETK